MTDQQPEIIVPSVQNSQHFSCPLYQCKIHGDIYKPTHDYDQGTDIGD